MPDPTIPELVARLRELHEKATPGPWSTNHRGGDISARIRGHEVQVALACGQGAMWDERDDAAAIMRANAELIAELRSALPAILDALERGTDAFARAWEEGAEAAFDAQYPGPDSEHIGLFGRALDEFYASNPYRTKGVSDE
jgi:hypothetical protein